MQLGVAYYPEHCSPEQWIPDFEKIRDAGIKRIRVGEFAWSVIEPAENIFDWDWLDKSIDLAGRYNIEVVLCTPTVCPPAWLIEKCPEILPVNDEGRKDSFGGRQHRCFNSKEYLEYSYRITELLSERYGKHSGIVAWQIDNELGAEHKWCYCELCTGMFQKYLESKYGTINELNRCWGNHFWSLDYQEWNQIHTPMKCANQLPVKHHPSLRLEFMRFSSDSIVKFARMQATIIRKHSPGKLVTTNINSIRDGDNLDWGQLFRDMDVAAIDIYSNKPYEIAFYADFAVGLKPGNAWILEFGSGSKNISESASLIQERGCDWLFIFKLKPFPWGQEQGRNELLTLSGGFTPAYYEFMKWNSESGKPAIANGVTELPETGVYYDFDSSWSYYIASWGIYNQHTYCDERFEYQDYLINVVYQAIFEYEKKIRIITGKEQIKGLATLIMPGKLIYEAELEKELISFVENGGELIVTSDFFIKNTENVFLSAVPEIYLKFFGNNGGDIFFSNHEKGSLLVNQCTFGKGKVIIVSKDADLDGWKCIWRSQHEL
jgi:beta-galactosidase